jgi:hypothetical protein
MLLLRTFEFGARLTRKANLDTSHRYFHRAIAGVPVGRDVRWRVQFAATVYPLMVQ